MRFGIFFILILTSICIFANKSLTQNSMIVGKWVTFNEKTNKPSSIIQMSRRNGLVEGKIIKIFSNSGEKKRKFCHLCRDERKGRPILGLTIIKHMKCDRGSCHDGDILDPRNGKVYHAKMRLIDGGRYLKVRGYIGIPLFGRSVTWARMSRQHLVH